MKRTLINIAILSTILGAQEWLKQVAGTGQVKTRRLFLKMGNLLEVTSVSVAPKITGTYIGS